MQKPTVIDRLRGTPFCTIGNHATVYRQGSLLCVVMIVVLAFLMPMMRDAVGEGAAFGITAFGIMFATALAVRFILPDGSEI